MSFERIGPYAYSRGDLIAASLAISFAVGARWTRFRMMLLVAVGLSALVGGIFISDYGISIIAVIALPSMFIAGPALRSQKNNRNIILSYDEYGIIAETDNVKTTYKWSTIQSYRKIGSRLFIMIGNSCALVVADRFTSEENMKRLVASLANHQRS